MSGRRDPRWARLLIVFGAALMVLSGTAIVGSRALINNATASITQTTLLEGDAAAADTQSGNNIDGAVNMLLVGIDARPAEQREKAAEPESAVLSDTIIILHIPATHDQAYLVSIPRDWRVKIPATPKIDFAGSTEKINSAFSYGYAGGGTELERRARGVDLLAKTLNRQTGITFNGAAIIDFSGFESVVHVLGGVDLCVDQDATSIHIGVDKEGKLLRLWYKEGVGIQGLPPGGKPMVYKKGCRRMSAVEALDYTRIRKSLDNGDYDRQRHQQQLIKAIAKEATSTGVLTDLGKLNRLMRAAGKAFVLDTQGVPVEDFLFTLKGVAANDLVLIKTNAGEVNTLQLGGVSYERLNDDSMDMLRSMRAGNLAAFLVENPQFIADSS